MKTKISIFILSGLLLSATLSSCKKDFLERPPLDQLSEATFWKNSNDVYQAVNAVYNQLPGDGIIYDDGASDNAYAQYPWESSATDVSAGTITSVTNAGWGFGNIRRANYFLANADKVVNMDPALLERYKAEVRFLRALFYFNMASNFGDVPFFTTVLKLGEENIKKSPKAEVLKFVTDELSAVALILPQTYAGGKPNEKGRITKGAALALKARVHLSENQWQLAADAATQVMGLGYSLFKVSEEQAIDVKDDYSHWVTFANADDEKKFRLGLRSYEALFHKANEGNMEVILDRQQIDQKDANFLNTYLLPGDIGGWSSVTPTQELVNSYESYKTGKAVSPVDPAQRAAWYTAKNPAFENEYKNRDPRFYATVLFENAPWNAIEDDYKFIWTEGASNMSKTGYNFRKLVDPKIYRDRVDNHANVILIRYAEILLTFAEAKNELSGPSSEVYDALDAIRTRAGMLPVDRTEYSSQASLRTLIRNERRIELAVEGNRYLDIRRWKIAPQVMKTINNIKNTQVQVRTWADKLYLMPVPQTEIDLSKGVLTQNTGY
ncbi:Starch-binding associating with outer membrane [Pedobacter steynii]|uniref:Starch-binding associating with outer membrane n=1 Tax=Pedobacter steynii TaxID=430522 RepID=A0A1G9T1J3_9SPHI|nr:RagB/SusD family nutrient uptake outer membrane protein [Pedobacter steynii]NQX37264.1 RagB/SusD family nutrient uptake outer membrane protein [Pedobacter steynii]SDM41488.1 Starch-binding associating with outer membrane [Pedobacter steynii]